MLQVQFGNSLEQMGEAVASQMLDLRSSLEGVKDAFNAMSYDASVAGIQSQKFYQTIESATSSLSFYGNYLKYASGMIRDFTKEGVMGFKDASEHATNMLNLFKNMGVNEKRAFVDIVGVEKILEDVEKLKSGFKKEESGLIKTIEGNRTKMGNKDISPAERKKLQEENEAHKNRLKVIRSEERRIDRIVKNGDITEIAMNLAMLTEKTDEYVMRSLKNRNIDVFEDDMAAIESSLAIFGMSAEDTNKWVTRARDTMHTIVDVAKSWDSEFKDAYNSSKSTFDLIGETLDLYAKGEVTWDSIKDRVQSYLKTTGLSTEAQAKYMDMASKSAEAAAEFAKKGVSGIAGKEKKLAEDAFVKGPSDKKREEVDQDSLKEMIAQTTTLGSYLGMTKESLKYSLASSKAQGAVAAATVWGFKQVGKIYNFMKTAFGGKYEKQKEKYMKGAGYKVAKDLATLQAALQEQLVTAEEGGDKEGAKGIRKELDSVRKDLDDQRNLNGGQFSSIIDDLESSALRQLEASNDSVKALESEKRALEERKKQVVQDIRLNNDYLKMMEEKGNKTQKELESVEEYKKKNEELTKELSKLIEDSSNTGAKAKAISDEERNRKATDINKGRSILKGRELWDSVANLEGAEQKKALKEAVQFQEEQDSVTGVSAPPIDYESMTLPGSDLPRTMPENSNNKTLSIGSLTISLNVPEGTKNPKAFGEAVAESVQQEVKKEFQKSQLRN